MIERRRIEDFTGGWFIGDFDPSILKTDFFEVSVKKHLKGEVWDKHYHAIATEFNYVFEGRVKIDDETYVPGDIFIVHPMHVVDPLFLEDCTIMCIKMPSVKRDKYVVER